MYVCGGGGQCPPCALRSLLTAIAGPILDRSFGAGGGGGMNRDGSEE